jgi:predicted small secreted protein
MEVPVKREIIALVAAIAATLAVSGCNTVEGAGEDVESVGEEIDEEI